MTASTAPAAPRTRRATELTMLAFAVGLAAAAYVIVGIAHDDKVPASVVAYGGGLAALFLVAHVAVRRFAPYADPLLLPAAAVLNGLGLVLIHRLDLAEADRAEQVGRAVSRGDAPLQLAWTGIGIVLFIAVLMLVRDHRVLQRYTYTAMAVGLLLLAIPAVLPASHSVVNGARVWVRFGGLSFQPGEIAKLLLEIFFAGYLVAKRDLLSLASRRFAGLDLPRGRDMGPVLLAWLASVAILVRESDLGMSLLFFGTFIVMLYVATERRSWLAIGVGLFLVGALFAYATVGHVRQRFDIWLHAFDPKYVSDESYQLVQGLFGLATGGLSGTGLGQGRPDIVPFAKTDFVMATIGEELGVAGVMAILVVYGLLVTRGMRTALAVRDSFGKLLAIGLSFGFALQVFVQVGGVTRLIPLTGMTLPFLSYGGSSLVANWVLVALLVRISDAARRPSQSPVAPAPLPLDEGATTVVRR